MFITKKKNKRCQVTIFIVIGIVLISIFSILFLIYNNSEDSKRKQDKELQYVDLIDKSAIKTTINLCFDSSLIKGLNYLGNQGGIIYGDQMGHVNEVLYLNYSGLRVNYGIKRRKPDPNFFPKPVPDYPYFGKLNKKNFPYYGVNNFPGLCIPLGINQDCSSVDTNGESFEKQIQSYMKNATKQCLHDTLIGETYSNYKINSGGEPKIDVKITGENVILDLDYNITFSLGDKVLTGTENYELIQKVRLKSLHNFITDLINTDIKDVNFDISKDFKKLKTIKTGFVVTKISNACTVCSQDQKFDDIIVISDKESLLENKPYKFFIARRNRIPALDLITYQGLELISEYDIKVKDGDEIIIKPVGYDADEEENELVFTYSGWKQTSDVDYDVGAKEYKDITSTSLTAGILPYWTTSYLYKNEPPSANYTTDFSDIGHHIVRVTIKDRQGLEDYQDVKIFVKDKPRFELTGLNDYDLVADYFASTEDSYTLKAKVQMIFPDVGEETLGENEKELQYKFYRGQDEGGEMYKLITTEDKTLKLKKDIDDPFKIPFSKLGDQAKLYYPDIANFDTIFSDLSVFQCFPHKVKNTAPYPYNLIRGLSVYNGKYTKNVDDNFKTDHACCKPDVDGDGMLGAKNVNWKGGVFEEASTECFNVNYNTCNPIFLWQTINSADTDVDLFYKVAKKDSNGKLSSYSKNSIPLVLLEGTNELDSKSDFGLFLGAIQTEGEGKLNDIYTREFKQYCSGERGNACSGDILQNFVHKTDCRDMNENDAGEIENRGEDETCTGPGIGAPSSMDGCSSLNLKCVYYSPGQSFEKDFLGDDDADGFCNNNEFYASEKGSKKYDALDPLREIASVEFPFKCKGQCDISNSGKCTFAADCVCDLDNTCDGVKYDDIGPLGICTGDGVYCSNKCEVIGENEYIESCQCAGGIGCDSLNYIT